MRHNSKFIQRSMASLEWLRTDDRITLELTASRTLKILLNSEDMNISFPNVSAVSARSQIFFLILISIVTLILYFDFIG